MTTGSRSYRRQVLAAFGVLALIARASRATGQPLAAEQASPRLVLQVSDCGEREAAVRSIVAVEIGDLLLERDEAPTAANDRLSVTWQPDGTGAVTSRTGAAPSM